MTVRRETSEQQAANGAVREIEQTAWNDLIAATRLCEQAQVVLDQLVSAIDSESDYEKRADILPLVREKSAEVARWLASHATARTELQSNLAWEMELDRLAVALDKLIQKVRAAEDAAMRRLATIGPQLDASIRGKQMASAYGKHRGT